MTNCSHRNTRSLPRRRTPPYTEPPPTAPPRTVTTVLPGMRAHWLAFMMTHQNVCRWHFSPSAAQSLRAERVNYLLCALHKFWELRTDTCFNTDCSVEAHGILSSPWTASVWGMACGTDLLRLTPAHSGHCPAPVSALPTGDTDHGSLGPHCSPGHTGGYTVVAWLERGTMSRC